MSSHFPHLLTSDIYKGNYLGNSIMGWYMQQVNGKCKTLFIKSNLLIWVFNTIICLQAVLYVFYSLHLLAISQSAFLNEFKARECIQLVFTTSQLVNSHLPLTYEHRISHGILPYTTPLGHYCLIKIGLSFLGFLRSKPTGSAII